MEPLSLVEETNALPLVNEPKKLDLVEEHASQPQLLTERPTLDLEKVSPALFAASAESVVSMLKGMVAFPVQIGGAVLGGVHGGVEPERWANMTPEQIEAEADKDPLGADIGWNLKKARNAFYEVGELTEDWVAPPSEEGKALFNWITGNIEWLGNQHGILWQNLAVSHGGKLLNTPWPALDGAIGADAIGAIVSEATKMLTYIIGLKRIGRPLAVRAAEYKVMRKVFNEKKAAGQFAEARQLVVNELYQTKAEMVNAFKEAARSGDEATMQQIIELNKNIRFNAAEIPEGTTYPLVASLPKVDKTQPALDSMREIEPVGTRAEALIDEGRASVTGMVEEQFMFTSKKGRKYTKVKDKWYDADGQVVTNRLILKAAENSKKKVGKPLEEKREEVDTTPEPRKTTEPKWNKDEQVYEFVVDGMEQGIYKDPESGWWMDAERMTPGSQTRPLYLGDTKVEAVAKVTELTKERMKELFPESKSATKPVKKFSIEGANKENAERLGMTYKGRVAGQPVFVADFSGKKVEFSPLPGETLEQAFARIRTPYEDELTFTASDNIKEIQKDIANREAEPVQPVEQIISEQVTEKIARQKKLLQEKYDLLQEELADELYRSFTPEQEISIDTNAIVREANITEETRALTEPGQSISVGDVTKKALNYGMDFKVRMNPQQAIEMVLTDVSGVERVFSTLRDAHDFLGKSNKDSVVADANYYAQKRVEIERSQELVNYPDGIERAPREYTTDEIDFTMARRMNENPPQIRLEILYDKAAIDKLASERILTAEEFKLKKDIGFSAYFLPIKPLLMDIELRTGIPLYESFMRMQNGIKTETLRSHFYQKQLNEATKGLNLMNRERVYRYLEENIPDKGLNFKDAMKLIQADKGLKEKFAYLQEKEFNSALALRKLLNEAGTEFGIPLENMLTNYAPRIKKSGMTVGEAVKTWKMSDEYKWWAEEERTGHLLAHEEDIRKVVHSYINRGARKKYLGAEIELATKTIKDANQSGQFTAAENMLLEKYIADVKGTPAGMDAAFQEVGLKMGRSLNKIIDKATFGKAEKRFTNPQYKKLRDEKGKLIKGKSGEDIVEMIGEEPGFFNTQSLMDDMISFHLRMSYAGALGFKPMAAMRNLLQPWITVLPVVGGIDFAIGMRRAMTKEGWNEAKAAGIMMDDYLPVAGEQTMVATGVLANIAYTSLKPYKLADSFNRAVAYHAMKSKVLRNGKTYTEGMRSLAKPEDAVRLRNDFIENTDLEFFHPVIMKNEILPLLKAGDMKALGERMGFQMAEQTQWVYRRANSPYFCRGKAGKLFGQFGTWPAWYADYMRTISTRGSKTNRAKRVATWATVNAGISEVGAELFGVDLGRYLWDGPFSWFGGISVSAITGFHKVIFGNEQEQAQGAQQLIDAAGMHLSGYLEMKNIVSAMEETRSEDQIKRALGFTPVERK